MLDVASPPARRMKQASWLDPRLLGGILLILMSIVLGARVVAGADRTVPVYAADRDLPAGHVIAEDDLRPVQVRMSSTETYIAGSEAVVGQVITRDVRKDELVARSAVAAQTVAPFRDLSLPVKPEHIPSDVDQGSRVDVIATTDASSGDRTWTVAKGLEVLRVTTDSGGFASSGVRLILKVPADLVLPLTAAMHSAEIDVVRVPDQLVDDGDIGSEAPRPQPAPGGGPSAAGSGPGAEPGSPSASPTQR